MSLEKRMQAVWLGERTHVPVTAAKYVLAIVAGAVTAVVLFCATYGSLYVTGNLPPPPLSNSLCVDEKLAFLRDTRPADPNFLVLGSSVAWRNIDSEVIARGVPGARPLNSGFCGMQMHQSAFIADWMIARWPNIRQVLLVVSPLDYKSCKGSGQVFDPVDTRKFVFERTTIWIFYLRYFDPVSLNRNIWRQMKVREGARILKVDGRITKYGDGPHDTQENRGLQYGVMPFADPVCLGALRTVATKLAEQGRSLMVVETPIHPDWKAKYDRDGKYRTRFWQDVRAALEGTGARVWNADEAEVLNSSAFIDAVHIRWSAATTFTREIVLRLPPS